MSHTTSPSGIKTSGTPILEPSYNSIQKLATDVESALSNFRMCMDIKFDAITALLEKRPLSPARDSLQSSKSSWPEKTWNLSPPKEPWIEQNQAVLPAAASQELKKLKGEFTEAYDIDDKLMPIAIVGMGCRFPQEATGPEKLWDMILRKQSARSEVPSDRFNVDAFYHPDSDKNGTMSLRGGHFLKQDLAAFDAPFFSISPSEARGMDPMQRILVEVVYEAMENAGIPLSTFAGSDTSCYVGCFTDDYDGLLKRDIELSPKYHSVGTGRAILSNRVSFCFDLKGPSMTIDTACSSSLIAVHLACQSLRNNESKVAIVGASNVILNPEMHIGMTNMHFLSPDSICYTFDDSANGYARGEGMAALILKPLHDAIRDGDTIRAVIRGSSANQDGKTAGITLPSKSAQVSLINTAYEQAGCDPSVTSYFEAHGTGTAAGDPIEASAIGATLGQYRSDGEEGKLYVGSVKTNIGHLEGTSGLAGLIKAVLSIEKGIIPPNIWFRNGNPAIDFDGWRIRVPTDPVPWPVPGLRRASINSFGYGGSNSHIVIDDAYNYLRLRGLEGKHRTFPRPNRQDCTQIEDSAAIESLSFPQLSDGNAGLDYYKKSDSSLEMQATNHGLRPHIFHLAAHEEGVALASASAYADHLASRQEKNEDFLDDLAYTLCERRSRLPWSCFVVAATKIELVEKLRAPTLKAIRQFNDVPRLAFVFTGQGAQWWRMGRELLIYPAFIQVLEKADAAVKKFGATWSLLKELNKDEDDSHINDADISQPLCTAVQIALVSLYASWSIHPLKVVGHSSGEIAAAFAIGALSIEAAMQIAYFRGLCAVKLKHCGRKGAMMAAGISEPDAQKRIVDLGDNYGKVVVACVNSPVSVTFSGDEAAIIQMEKALDKDGIFARRLKVNTAYHSHHMLSVSESYRQSLSGLTVTPITERKTVEMISSATGQSAVAETLDADYWVKNLVSCVQFSKALEILCSPRLKGKKDRKNKTGVDILIELGPHSALAGPVKQVLASMTALKSATILYHSALIRERDASVTGLEVAASLFARGYPLDMHAALFPHPSKARPRVLVDLPSYPWNHSKKYWSESRLSTDYRFRRFPRHDILGAPTSDWNPTEPRWRNFLRVSEQPWLKGHMVQGVIVYPAAGYISMATEAARQVITLSSITNGTARDTASSYTIRELTISRALIIPATEEGIEVIFSMRPRTTSSIATSETWKEFRIFSYTPSGGWAEHCCGLISVNYNYIIPETEGNQGEIETLKECQAKLQVAKLACTVKGDCDELYEALAEAGLVYGPHFRNIIQTAAGEGKALCTIQIPDVRSIMPMEFEFDHFIHPATMDTFLQMIIPALGQGNARSIKDTYIPTFIQEINFSANTPANAGHKFQAIAEAKFHGFRTALANIVILDDVSLAPMIRIDGAKCTALSSLGVDGGADTPESNIRRHGGIVIWEPDIDMLTKSQLEEIIRDSLRHVMDPPGRVVEHEMLGYYFCEQVLKQLSDVEVASMPKHLKSFYRFLQVERQMVMAGKHEHQTPEWKMLDDPQVAAKIAHLICKFSNPNDSEGRMFVRMGQALTSIMRQEIDPLSLLIEDNLLHEYYATGVGVNRTYIQMARYITLLSHKYPDLDYLEIGAGTGGATVPALNALGGHGKQKYPRFRSYTYTDISPAFFEVAMEKFSEWADLMKYRRLDIEMDPDKQGFENQRYDVILAANVLHATHDINLTLANVRKLLKPGGKLILLEITHPILAITLAFGTLPGWWMSIEPWRQLGPTLEESKWQDVLRENGFSDLQASVPDRANPVEHATRVMVATAVEEADRHSTIRMPVSLEAIIVCPQNCLKAGQDLINATQRTLESRTISTTLSTLSGLTNVELNGKICISFAEFEDAVLPNISPSEFSMLQRLVQEPKGLLWFTCGGTVNGVRPELSLFQGLARSLRAEQEQFPCITVDFDPKERLPTDAALKLLVNVFEQTFVPGKAFNVNDREISEQNGVLCIKRIIEDHAFNMQVAIRSKSTQLVPEPQPIHQPDRPLKLAVGEYGMLSSLFFDDAATFEPLLHDHVEIEVQAVGLNSHDLFVCMGDKISDYLGNECAGVVTKVGRSVRNFMVGDRVNAWCPGSFSTSVRNPADCVQHIPDNMSFATAASLPFAYIAAYYSLIHLAQLRSGESILIHAAAGGVGQAAIQIGKMIGTEIFVTVGTEEKKNHLISTYGLAKDHIFASRDLTFARGVMRLTGGRGVDVVLNSLTDEALGATWRCIAPFGRFIEMGKKDAEANSRLDMAPFSKNVSFASVNITLILKHNRKLAAELFSEVMNLVRAGTINETSPIAVYSFSQIEDSFRLLQTGKHFGKIVLEPRKADLVRVMPKPPNSITFPGNASYLLAGGLGGLGRCISQWMVSNGARNFIFVSRSGASTPEAIKFVNSLADGGVHVQVLRCDIADEQKFSTSLRSALKTMPPIRGVIQAAMVLKDQIFLNMSFETFMNTVRPKVQGSWSLHKATLDQPLDFFILLSSASGLLGNAGQSNYVAACTYQVALAAHRVTQGLPATAIDLGKVLDVGFVAENTGTVSEQNLIKIGMKDIREEEFLAMMELAMMPQSHTIIANGYMITGVHTSIDPSSDEQELPFWSRDPVFSHLESVRPHLSKSARNGSMDGSSQQPLSTLIATAISLSEATASVLDAILRKLSRSLMTAVEDIDPGRPTSAYGIDSLVAVDIRNWIFREAKADVPVFEILQAATLTALAQKVAENSTLLNQKLKIED